MTVLPTTGTLPPREHSHRVHPGSCLSLAEIPPAAQLTLVERSRALAAGADHDRPLRSRTVGVLFTRTSTRTRTAFSVASVRLGGHPLAYGPGELQLGTGESLADTGRVLGSMLDVLVVRTAGPHADLVTLADAAGIPVINAMTTLEHPTQGVCDLATIAAHVGLPGIRLLYVGEGNNTAVALANGLAAVDGAEVVSATPTGYGLPAGCLDVARARATSAGSGAVLSEVHSLAEVPDRTEAVDIVYTTRWQTTGTTKPDPSWRESFWPFRVDQALLDRWPAAKFMHDLPAHRGDEVTGAVLDGPRSLAWEQARMKLYSAIAVLERAAVTRLQVPPESRHGR